MDVISPAMRQIYRMISHPAIDIWSNYVHPPLYLCYMIRIHHILSADDSISSIYGGILNPMHWSSIAFTLTFGAPVLRVSMETPLLSKFEHVVDYTLPRNLTHNFRKKVRGIFETRRYVFMPILCKYHVLLQIRFNRCAIWLHKLKCSWETG